MTPGALSVQLFTFRDAYAADPDSTIARIADIGFRYVEPYGHGAPDAPLGPRLDALHALQAQLDVHGLKLLSRHVAAPYGPHADAVLAELDVLPTVLNVVPGPMLVPGFGADALGDIDTLKRWCDAMNGAAERMEARGAHLGYHNHWWEFLPLTDGRVPFDVMLERLNPRVFIELDAYWALTGGLDVTALLRRLGTRVRALHLKDGPVTPELTIPHLPLGDGLFDYRAVIEAAPSAHWHVLEMDFTDGDAFADIARSAWRLIDDGLSRWEPA